MRLVMLGGTFNPPHKGHLKIAEAVRREFNYEKVVLIPSFIPAHKEIAGAVSSEQRLAMTRLAAAELEHAFASDCEFIREGVSYSFDTIQYLKKNYTDGEKPGLIIGDDLVPGFHNWHRAEELAQQADIIVCHRGTPADLDFPFAHRYFQNSIFSASSTELRRMAGQREDLQDYLPASVIQYIKDEGLYVS